MNINKLEKLILFNAMWESLETDYNIKVEEILSEEELNYLYTALSDLEERKNHEFKNEKEGSVNVFKKLYNSLIE